MLHSKLAHVQLITSKLKRTPKLQLQISVPCLDLPNLQKPKPVRSTELLCRAWKEAGLEPVKKLVLECMMLQPLSARGMVKLLTTKTLAAAEVQAVIAAQRKLDLPSQKQAMQALADCGFAALKRLNKSGMVSNFKDEGEQGADAISFSFTLLSFKTKVRKVAIANENWCRNVPHSCMSCSY